MAVTISQMSKLDNEVIMLVDSMNLAFRYKHSGAKNFMDQYMQTVDSLRKSYKAAHVVIAADKGASTFRRSLHPGYKQGRKDKFENQTEAERKEFEEFFAEFTSIIDTYIEVDDYPTFRFDGVEADDIAAYIVNKYKSKYKIWLMSSDKDWDLLIDNNVSRFSYVTRKEITIDNWSEHYDYNPEDHISIKCLTGDTGDSIPGVPGIGPKKAQSLIETYGSTYDIIASLPIQSKYKYIAALNEFGADNLLLNYKLMDLVSYCEEAIGPDNCKIIDTKMEQYLK